MSPVSQIPLKLGQFGILVGLIAPCTCDVHRRTRLASTDVLSSLLDLHGREETGHEGCGGVKASSGGLVQACHRGKHNPRVGRQEDKRVASITKVIDASRRSSLDEVESQSWQIPREEQYWIEPS